MINMDSSMKTTELRKHCAAKANTRMGSMWDLRVGKANTSRRARCWFLMKFEGVQVLLAEVLGVDDHDEVLVV